jgi:hypothetical protein
MSLTKEKREMAVDNDVERRVRAFEVQLAEWSAAERPGVPVLALPDTNPEPGTCVSCGGPRGKELRCVPCLSAVNVVLASPISRAIQTAAARLQASKENQ